MEDFLGVKGTHPQHPLGNTFRVTTRNPPDILLRREKNETFHLEILPDTAQFASLSKTQLPKPPVLEVQLGK